MKTLGYGVKIDPALSKADVIRQYRHITRYAKVALGAAAMGRADPYMAIAHLLAMEACLMTPRTTTDLAKPTPDAAAENPKK